MVGRFHPQNMYVLGKYLCHQE